MTLFFTVFGYVMAILFVIALIALNIIAFVTLKRYLIAKFNDMNQKQDVMLMFSGKVATAQLEQLQIQNMMFVRYEKNLAAWYNAQTGETWSVDAGLKNRQDGNRAKIAELAMQLEAERELLNPEGV